MFRFLNLILVVLILLLQVRLWFGESSLPETWQLESRIETRKAENADLAKRNEALAAEVADLRRGLDAIEERARYELGMVRPNETFFLLIDEPEQGGKVVSPAAGLSQ
ncbi:cell division protein FtsB [Oceanospirillum sp.]|uniref:cell division protein FtsB n=1 Tax=Oceanospirillum sp. TaxID=2021254 RepID=UPI003A924A0E